MPIPFLSAFSNESKFTFNKVEHYHIGIESIPQQQPHWLVQSLDGLVEQIQLSSDQK